MSTFIKRRVCLEKAAEALKLLTGQVSLPSSTQLLSRQLYTGPFKKDNCLNAVHPLDPSCHSHNSTAIHT